MGLVTNAIVSTLGFLIFTDALLSDALLSDAILSDLSGSNDEVSHASVMHHWPRSSHYKRSFLDILLRNLPESGICHFFHL